MKTPSKETVRAVVNQIPLGKQNAIQRHTLASRVGMSDREVRACIEAARRDGVFVVTEHRGGYYLADAIEDVERQYRIDHARALSVLSRLAPMRKYLKERGVKV